MTNTVRRIIDRQVEALLEARRNGVEGVTCLPLNDRPAMPRRYMSQLMRAVNN